MGRRKGDTYRKWKTKEVVKVRCPHWNLPIDVIGMVKHASNEVGASESYIIETAIKNLLTPKPQKLTNPTKIFTKI